MAKLVEFIIVILLIAVAIVAGVPVDISKADDQHVGNFETRKYNGALSAISGVAGENSLNYMLSSGGMQRRLLSARMRSGRF